jgi:PD-(D/E)XK endonuclease
MNDLVMHIQPAKRRGEWAELRFMSSAAERGLCVSKPWGDTSHYDFVVEHPCGRFLRIQVKSTASRKHKGYAVRTRGSQGAYPPNAFDFVAAYVIPEDVWFIIPEPIIQGMTTIIVCPGVEGSRYEEYRDAWSLLGA